MTECFTLGWRQELKRWPGVDKLWPLLRAWQQERRIRKDQAYYEQLARVRGIVVLEKDQVRTALQQRLAKRGIRPGSKHKGHLRIIYASEMTSWEPHQIPPALAVFGEVITYSLPEHGFHSKRSNWPLQRHKLDVALVDFLRDEHARRPVDVFVSYLSGGHIAPETIRAIGDLGIITCAFHWDDRLSFRGSKVGGRWTGPAALASAYDLNLTNASASLIKYFVEGGVAIFWPEAVNPEHFRPLGLLFEYDVSFVGGCYGQRPALINHLRRHGIKVETFGPGWPNGLLPEDKMIEVYARSRINLGISGIGYSMKETCLKGRDFEVPMCGALYLTSDQPDLHRVYEVGKEIVTYKNEKDCAGKIKWILAYPEEAAKIREAGGKRALKDHAWDKRFSDIFEIGGILKQ